MSKTYLLELSVLLTEENVRKKTRKTYKNKHISFSESLENVVKFYLSRLVYVFELLISCLFELLEKQSRIRRN